MDQRARALENFSTRIVNRIHETRDGGIIQFIIDNDPFTRPSPNFVADYFNLCINDKGTYKAVIVSGAVWAFAIPIFVLCFLFCQCIRRCFATSRTKICLSVAQLWKRTYGRCISSDGKTRRCFSQGPRIRMPNTPRGRVLSVLIICIIFSLLMCIGAILLTIEVDKPLQATTDENGGPSVKGSLNKTFESFQLFVTRSVKGGKVTTNNVINDFSNSLKVIVKHAVGNFTDNLLFDYGVTTLFTTATRVITDIQNVLKAMKFIKASQNNVFVRYHEFNGFVNTYRDLLSNLEKVCALSMSLPQKTECQGLLFRRNQLEVNIDQSKLNFDSSTSLLFILQEMQLNISSIANELTKARTSIDSMLSNVYTSIQKEFNLNAIFHSLDNVWDVAENFTDSTILKPVDDIQRTGTVDKWVNTISSIRKIVNAVIGFIFFLMIVLSICLLLMLLTRRLEFDVTSDKPPYTVDLVSISQDKKLLQQKASSSIPVKPFTVFVLFFGLFVIFPAIIVVTHFFAGSLMENEACRYLKSSKGLSQVDNMVDKYIDSNWKNWISQLKIDLNGIQLNLKPPHNIIEAIDKRCVNDSQRLMTAIGLTDILNVTQLLDSPMFSKMLGSGKGYAKTMIAKLDVSSMLPTSFTTVLREAVNLTKMMVDDINYKNSIRELRKPLLKLDDYGKFVKDLSAFVNSLLGSHASDINLVFVSKLIEPMQRKVPEYLVLTNLLNEVRQNFEVLESTRTVSSGLQTLIIQFNGATAVLKDPKRMVSVVDPLYDGVMEWTVPAVGDVASASFLRLEKSLFPCDNLSEAFHTTTRSLCLNLLPQLNTFTVCYGWCVLWYQILFLLLFILLQKLQRQQEATDSDC